MCGISPTPQLQMRPIAEIVTLIYRDDITVKHADKSRLKQAFYDAAQEAKKGGSARPAKHSDVRVQMLVAHLVQACRHTCARTFFASFHPHSTRRPFLRQVGLRGDPVIFAAPKSLLETDSVMPLARVTGSSGWPAKHTFWGGCLKL